MPTFVKSVCALGILTLVATFAYPQKTKSGLDVPKTMVITFKDGHQQTFLMSEVARVQYVGPSEANLSTEYFLGKWEVGDSNSGTFTITLESNGEANKTLGASHGIWTIEGDEARINWDDGWHDAIRKTGLTHEKLAYEPGKNFGDEPSNITKAEKLNKEPI